MKYEGILYRPPSEANSLIVQATVGCAHNRCRFCSMYKEKQFKIRDFEDVKADFLKAKEMYGNRVRRIFLADGDALAIPTERLVELLNWIAEMFPDCERISAYGTAQDALNKTVEELSLLCDAGLKLIYIGAESGSDRVLEYMNKGVDSRRMLEGALKLKGAGMQLSMTLISGLGGELFLKEHAMHSAELISNIKPEYLGFLTLMLEQGTPLSQDVQAGRFKMLPAELLVEEMKLFLQHVDSEGTVFRSNHASNYMMLKGKLNRDIPIMIRQLERALDGGEFREEFLRML